MAVRVSPISSDEPSASRAPRWRKLMIWNIFFVFFASELIHDVDCGALRGGDVDTTNIVADISDSIDGDRAQELISTRVSEGLEDNAIPAVDTRTLTKETSANNNDDKVPVPGETTRKATSFVGSVDSVTIDHGEADTHKSHPVNHTSHHRPMGAPALLGSYDKSTPDAEFWSSEGPKDSTRPLLEFVMIVKNEVASIEATIKSVKPWVDRWTILDTGSTDGTKDLIHAAFKGVPGNLHEGEFVDFSSTRNRALELAGHRCIFNLMLSGDESIQNGAAMRGFLEKRRDWKYVEDHKHEKHEAYNMRILFGSTVYDSTRIGRTDAHWFYVGATHEYMTNAKKQVANIRIQRAADDVPAVFHDLSRNEHSHKMRRWRLDLNLLQQEWKRHPNKTRTAFYTAQTYECLGELESALTWYQKRHDLGGWNEEAYEALYRMGRVALRLKRPWPEVQQLWLDAHAYLPKRIEPLYKIATHYFEDKRNYPLAYLFASRAAHIPYPSDLRLFISKDIYDYNIHDLVGIVGFYVGAYADGKRSVMKALEARPGDKRLLKNLKYYSDRGA